MVANKNDLVNNSLSKIKSAPGFGGRIGAGIGYIGTMDYIDTDKDGVDDRNQRGPGQPYITFEKATQEEKNRFDSALRRKQLSLVFAGRLNPEEATELKSVLFPKK